MKSYLVKSVLILTVLVTSTLSFAADAKMKMESMETPEMRAKMINMHQKMLDCLRSDKPLSTCKADMMKSCHEGMGDNGCSMMKEMHNHGKMKNMKGMNGMSEEDSEKSTTEDEHAKHH